MGEKLPLAVGVVVFGLYVFGTWSARIIRGPRGPEDQRGGHDDDEWR